jgi:hypothetical protein
MGNTELIESNHRQVIDPLCIEGRLPIHPFYMNYAMTTPTDRVNIHWFDDRGATGTHLPRSSWFTRLRLDVSGAQGRIQVWYHVESISKLTWGLQGINLQCRCQRLYSPVLDRQRFCRTCQEWFHETCMDKIGRPQLLTGATAAECLMKVPILRGWQGDHSAADWMTVGSGRKLEAVQRRREAVTGMSGDVEEEWDRWSKLLSQEFVRYVRETRFVRYLCPHCSRHI